MEHYLDNQGIDVQLSECYSPSAANKMMAALCRVLEEAWTLGQMSAEDYHRAIASSTDATAIAIERKTGQRLLTGRALSIGEVQALFHIYAQDESVKGSRDAVINCCIVQRGSAAFRSSSSGLG